MIIIYEEILLTDIVKIRQVLAPTTSLHFWPVLPLEGLEQFSECHGVGGAHQMEHVAVCWEGYICAQEQKDTPLMMYTCYMYSLENLRLFQLGSGKAHLESDVLLQYYQTNRTND